MTYGALKKKVLGRSLSYAFRFEILSDREVSESDPTTSSYVLARPCSMNVVGARSP